MIRFNNKMNESTYQKMVGAFLMLIFKESDNDGNITRDF